MSDSMRPHGLYSPWNSPESPFPSPKDLSNPGIKPRLPHCRLSNKGSLHWLNIPYFAYPFISWWLLGSFHFLPIMNDAVENIHEHIFWLYVLFLLDIYLGVEMLGQVNSVIFWGTFYCFPKWLYYYTTPPTMYDIWGFDFFISVPTLVIVGCFLF